MNWDDFNDDVEQGIGILANLCLLLALVLSCWLWLPVWALGRACRRLQL